MDVDVRAIRVALAEAFEGLGYRTYSVIPANGELPFAAVGWPDPTVYHRTLAGGGTLSITCSVAWAIGGDFDVAQEEIDAAMSTGPTGFGEQLDLTAGPWTDAIVLEANNVRQVALDSPALVVDLEIEVTV